MGHHHVKWCNMSVMAESVIYRYEVPVDDQWHEIPLSGPVLHVAARTPYVYVARTPYVVEFWALHSGGPMVPRRFRVFGTGQPIDEQATHRGTARSSYGRMVWHLMEAGYGDIHNAAAQG